MRKFGQQSQAELDEARAAATDAIERYGEFERQEQWDRFRKFGIWTDHPAVQSALTIIMRRNDALTGGEVENG